MRRYLQALAAPTAPACCETCGKRKELRPYGKGGAWVCFDCAMGTPESKAEAMRRMRAAVSAAAAKGGPIVVRFGAPPISLEDVLKREDEKDGAS